MAYYEPRLPCDATQIGRFRTAIGEEGLEQLLKFTIQTAVEMKAIKPEELERGTSGFHSAREGDCAPGGQPLAGDRALQVGQGRQGPLSQTSCRFPDLHGSTTTHEPKPTLQRIPRASAEQGQTARHAQRSRLE